jgi:photosystem II stability/assembly factor-like uncharacterized protein
VKSVCGKVGGGVLISLIAGVVAILMALLPLSAAQAAPPPGTWTKTRPNSIESDVTDTYFLSTATQGWAVGSPFTGETAVYHCWHTTNAGVDWTPQPVGNPATTPGLGFVPMESVYFRNANLGWTCGYLGIISRCTDSTGTGNWTVTRYTGDQQVMQDVFAPSDTEVWAVGVNAVVSTNPTTWAPVIVKSDDAGLTWHDMTIRSISFADSSNGWAVGPGGALIHTSDGGSTWAFQASGTASDLNAIQAVSADEAWAAGAGGTVLHTTDAGATWSGDFSANAVFTLDSAHVWVAGGQGTILFYSGTSWVVQSSGTMNKINAIQFLDMSYGWAVGDGGLNLFTTNGGTSWSPGSVLPDNLNGVSIYDDSGDTGNYLISVCGNNGAGSSAYYQTTDASPGGTPTVWSGAGTPPVATDLKAIDFSSAAEGVTVGSGGAIDYTSDGGSTWTAATGTGATNFNSVAYGGSAKIWFAVGEKGGFWQSRDMSTWNPVTVRDVAAIDANTRFYVGNSGMIVKETAGPTWEVEDSKVSQNLNGVTFTDANNLLAVGDDDTATYTNDGGTTWTTMTTGIATDWQDASVVMDGLAALMTFVGNGGHILQATDGTLRTPTLPVSTPDLRGVAFADKDSGWAVGTTGTVWHTADGSAANPTWTEIQTGGADLNSIALVPGTSDGWAVGQSGTGCQITAGAFNPLVIGTADLYKVAAPAADFAYAVGKGGAVAAYRGTSWSPGQLGWTNDVHGVDFSGSDGAIAGDGMMIWTTDNGGASSWTAASGIAATSNALLSASFFDTNDGWLSGEAGLIYRYDHGPVKPLASNTTASMKGISICSSGEGYAVGPNRTVIKTTNGTTWTSLSALTSTNTLHGLTFPANPDPAVNHGWFAGASGTIIHYDNGLFKVQDAGGTTQDYNGISLAWDAVASQYVGAAVGNSGTARHTANTGAAWANAGGVPGVDLNGIDVVSPTKAILCGDYNGGNVGTVRISGNGGASWTTPTSPPDVTATQADLCSVAFGDDTNDHAWVAGKHGVVYETSDLGDTWTAQDPGVHSDLLSVCAYYDGGAGAYSLFAAGAVRTIVTSADGGTSWTKSSYVPAPGALTAGSAVNTSNIYMCGLDSLAGGDIIHTKNGGASFTAEADGGPPLNGVSAYDASDIWAVGNAGLVLFSDGTVPWVAQDSHVTGALQDVASTFDGATYRCVTVGDGGVVRYSLNASAGDGNWVAPTTNPNKNTLRSCTFQDFGGGGLDVMFAGGDAGSVLVGTYAAGAFNIQYSRGPANKLYGTYFIDKDTGWAVGANGTILYTADAGGTWNVQDSGTTEDLYAIAGMDVNNIYAVGASGTIQWFNGGVWNTLVSGTGDDFHGVAVRDSGLGYPLVWAVGQNGTIKYNHGAPSWDDQSSGTTATLRGIHVLSDTFAVAVGGDYDPGTGDSTQAITIYDGANWTGSATSNSQLNGVCVSDTGNAWAVGQTGTLLHYNGTTWSAQDSGTTTDLNAVMFGAPGHPDASNGWAVGSGQVYGQQAPIIRTYNGGGSWSPETSGTGIQRGLYGLATVWNGTTTNVDAFAAGDWGQIQKRADSGALPQITPPLSPNSGDVGTNPVVIAGTGFGADQATVNGHVYFNGNIEAAVSSWTDTSISVTVPDNAYGSARDVRVVNDGGASNGAPFSVNVHVNGVGGFYSGGDTVTITGSGFGTDPGAGNRSTTDDHVRISGTLIPDADITSWANNSIVLTLPGDIDPGQAMPLEVARGGAVNGDTIEIRPKVTGSSVPSASVGGTVTLTGVNFGLEPATHGGYSDSNCVKMQDMDDTGLVAGGKIPVGSVTAWSQTSVTFTVPYNAAGPDRFHPWTGAMSVIRGSSESSVSNPSINVLPSVTGVAPASDTVGSPLTVTGSAFGEDQTAAAGHVYVNGVEATSVTSWAYGQAVVSVPETISGPVTVTTLGGTSNADHSFSVVPDIAGISGGSKARAGDHVTITGTGFGPTRTTSNVVFDNGGAGVVAAVNSWSATSLVVTVPNTAITGDVAVTTPGGTSTGFAFTMLPKITTLTPSVGSPGKTVVTISGFTFGATQGASTVAFNGVNAGTATSWADSSIVIKAPRGCTSGNVVVTTADGASNGVTFTVGPNLTGISPSQGPPTGLVTLTGENFKALQGTGKVTFNGVDAGTAVSWSDTSITVKVPYGGETGDVVVTTSEGSSNALPFSVGLSKTYYFAEGTTRANFEEWLCLMNPNTSAATVQVTYMLGDGSTKHFDATIPKTSRMTLYVADVVGLEKDVSTKVTSSLPIVAERPMYFNYGGAWTGGHDVIGAIAPEQDWYFAEGNTRDGFEEWICLQNPNPQPANAVITYMLSGGQTAVQTVQIPATARRTISVKEFLGPNKDCSARVHADQGVIAERPMYFVYKPGVDNWTGGHDVIGANAPGNEWYFAEGTTRSGFDEWLCLQNPGKTEAAVTVSYMLETGDTRTQLVSVPASSRVTVDVVTFIGTGRDVSMHVTSTQPIVAERPMYFDYVGLTGGSDVVGSTCSSSNWYFAEGATQNGFQEWMSIQNPGDTEATVTITYMLGTGKNITNTVTVKAHARTTVDVNGAVGWGQNVSAKVTSPQKVIIERPMYFNDHGWTGGHDVVGFHY